MMEGDPGEVVLDNSYIRARGRSRDTEIEKGTT